MRQGINSLPVVASSARCYSKYTQTFVKYIFLSLSFSHERHFLIIAATFSTDFLGCPFCR